MTISSPASLDTTAIQDGQPPGSINPAVIRALCDSAFGIFATLQTASYTLVLADRGTCVEMNVATANTLTVPPHSSVAFDVGTVIEICQVGAGQITITAGVGVTLRTATSLTSRAQWSTISLRQRATDEWVLSGDLT